MKRARIAFLILVLAASGQVSIAQGIFTATGATTVPRSGHTATLLPGGKVLIAGGWEHQQTSASNSVASAELYDPTTGTFGSTGNMTTSRVNHTATLLPDGRVLIAGGIDARNQGLASTELYDPATGTFSTTGAMGTARSAHMAALLPNGKVLVAGGDGARGAEIYDPAAGTFSPTGDMQIPSYGVNTAMLLADGRVFIGGGQTSDLYDSTTGTFSTTGGWSQIVTNWPDAQNVLTSGKVLITGGDANALGSIVFAGLYDPGTGTFATTGSMKAARSAHVATTLPDGTALITGGQMNSGQIISAAELYDPATGGFTVTGSMVTGRCCHTATLLDSGQVLIVGGVAVAPGFPSYQPSYPATAELYSPPVLSAAPELFSSSDGKGQGAIWDGITGKIASPSAPAVAGEILSLYTRGLGNGSLIPPQVAVGGRLGEIRYFGDAPGYPGYSQVNFRIPDGISGSAVPVRLIYLGRSSNEVTIAVN